MFKFCLETLYRLYKYFSNPPTERLIRLNFQFVRPPLYILARTIFQQGSRRVSRQLSKWNYNTAGIDYVWEKEDLVSNL